MERVEVLAIVSGHVQGVGFRYSVQGHALNLKITGTVRNCPNGTVEIVAQGTRQDLEQFLEVIKSEPGLGRVSAIDKRWCSIQRDFVGFAII